jgi:amino acid transporter
MSNTNNQNNTSPSPHIKLGTFAATSICANDILSSVLYVSGLVIPIAGIYAPIVMLLVGAVLFLYRGVYREVVESMPINGGTYNALLNATTKNVAAIAGVLTILSYTATAVISAKSGVDYLFNWSLIKKALPANIEFSSLVIAGTILVLGFFAALVISGVKDSAKVAVGIFCTHLFTLFTLVAFSIVYIIKHPDLLKFSQNITNTDMLIENLRVTTQLPLFLPFVMLIFLGFSTSLLGVSGFESSANFVEEQDRGVFKKTLTNMAISVTIINPLIALIFLSLFDLKTIHNEASYLLSFGGNVVGGFWLQFLVVIDAFLVLCGAVLTSFVGITGLVSRMTLDECLPQFLNKQNAKGSYTRIIIAFFLLCVSILLVSKGNIPTLGGIYAIAFLAVMSMFAISNLILKNDRKDLKRKFYWPTYLVVLALTSTLIGLAGNMIARDGILGDSSNLIYFLQYFIPLSAFVIGYIYRDFLFTWLSAFVHQKDFTSKMFTKITDSTYAVFVRDIENLYNLMGYINTNEVGRNIIFVHCKDPESGDKTYDQIQEALPVLKQSGVFKHLNIKVVQTEKEFGPAAITCISEKYQIAKNRIFIGSIHDSHQFDYEDLGGVRIIAN